MTTHSVLRNLFNREAHPEIHTLHNGGTGYIDDSFARPDGPGYDSPVPVTDQEAADLIAAGAKDCRIVG